MGFGRRTVRRRRVHRGQHRAPGPAAVAHRRGGRADRLRGRCTRWIACPRSLLDFAQLMRTFEQKKVSLCQCHAAVQHGHQHGTAGPERAAVVRPVRAGDHLRADPRQDRRDAAQGKWAGGHPLLGLRRGPRRVQAHRERQGSRAKYGRSSPCTSSTSRSCRSSRNSRRKWVGKKWADAQGPSGAASRSTRTSLYRLLTNVVTRGRCGTSRRSTTASTLPSSIPASSTGRRHSSAATARPAAARCGTSSRALPEGASASASLRAAR